MYIEFQKVFVSFLKMRVLGIGRVSLDVRLGCLDQNLTSDSEPQKIIDAAKYALRNVAILELKFPLAIFPYAHMEQIREQHELFR